MSNNSGIIRFIYDEYGRGDCELWDESGQLLDRERARTGSVNKSGKLVNAISVNKKYAVTTPSMDTEEPPMVITPGLGWKMRMHEVIDGKYLYTHYLFHPDGNLPGSDGCIVFVGTDAIGWRHAADALLSRIMVIPVILGRKGDANA